MTDSFFKDEIDQTEKSDIPSLEEGDSEGIGGSSRSDSFLTEEGRMAAIMSYIPFLCFVPLLNMKDNKEARLHARQGVLLFLIELVAVLFLVDGISDFVFRAVLILAVALSVAGIFFSLQGKNYKLPLIGDLAEKTKL